jgi:type II secretory pathway predicted ATPase ExeA
MYKQFYGLARNPFEISPDPNFYCPTPAHNEALASLVYGIEKKRGFVVLTGEVGTGKTLLVQCLMRWLSAHKIAFSHVFNTRLSANEFLKYILADLGLVVAGKDKSEWLLQLNRYLINRYQQGSKTVVIIDEGQLLDWEVLEEIRLLTNLETFTHKLLQIVLTGQPELDEKLDSENLRQLKQRIAFRACLKPLTQQEIAAYIARRMELAGAKPEQQVFPAEILPSIAEYSRGIPRLINVICENALIAGFVHKQSSITPQIIEQVATDFHLNAGSRLHAVGKNGNESDLRKELMRLVRMIDKQEPPLQVAAGRERGN